MSPHIFRLCVPLLVAAAVLVLAAADGPSLTINIPRFGLIKDLKERLDLHMEPNYLLLPHIYRSFINAGENPDFLENRSVTEQCLGSLQQYYSGLVQKKSWAWKMYDSTGKQSAGIFVGGTTWSGYFDECLTIVTTSCAADDNSCVELDQLGPQFCSVHMSHAPWRPKMIQAFNLPFPVPYSPFIVDVCVPKNCSEDDIFGVVDAFLAIDNFGDNITVKSVHCHSKISVLEDVGALCSVIILTLVLALVILGTCYDIYRRRCKPNVKHGPEVTIGYNDETDQFGILNIMVPTRKNRGRRGTLSSSENIDQAIRKGGQLNGSIKISRKRSASEPMQADSSIVLVDMQPLISSVDHIGLQRIAEDAEKNNDNQNKETAAQSDGNIGMDEKDLTSDEDSSCFRGKVVSSTNSINSSVRDNFVSSGVKNSLKDNFVSSANSINSSVRDNFVSSGVRNSLKDNFVSSANSINSSVRDNFVSSGISHSLRGKDVSSANSLNSCFTSSVPNKPLFSHQASVVLVRPCHKSKKLTLYDNLLTDLLLSFSFRKNTRHILADGSADTLFCLNGVRVMSIAWIVLGNVYGIIYQNPDIVENSVSAVKMTQSFWMQMVINTTLGADSFFILSGTLMAYNFIKIKTKTGRHNKGWRGVMSLREYGFMIVHRLFRILPCYAVLLMLATNLLPFLGRGPRWSYEIDSVKVCKKNWWANMLFISNFYDPDNMCQPHTYYLSNDFQFFLFSPVVLIPLLVAPKIGLGLVCFFVLGQIVVVGTINTGINGNVLRMKANNYFSLIYVKPYSRIGIYCIGLALGYLLHNCDRQMKFRKLPLYIGWVVSCGLIFILPYVTYLENREGGHAWSGMETALFEAFSRPVWALSLSWVIFACSTGQGAFVNKLLSWNIFLPLCRITYGVFLLHPILISVVIESSHHNFFLNFGELIYTYLAMLLCSWGLAFVLIACVECPFTTFESRIRLRFKAWLGRRKDKNLQQK